MYSSSLTSRAANLVAAVAITAGLIWSTLAPAVAQDVRVKDIARVQGVTQNQLVGLGIVTGLAGTGDSTSVVFTSEIIQSVLTAFGHNTSVASVRTRNVAVV